MLRTVGNAFIWKHEEAAIELQTRRSMCPGCAHNARCLGTALRHCFAGFKRAPLRDHNLICCCGVSNPESKNKTAVVHRSCCLFSVRFCSLRSAQASVSLSQGSPVLGTCTTAFGPVLKPCAESPCFVVQTSSATGTAAVEGEPAPVCVTGAVVPALVPVWK